MLASSLRPLMSMLRLRSGRRRLNRQQLLRLVSAANRRPDPRRRPRWSG